MNDDRIRREFDQTSITFLTLLQRLADTMPLDEPRYFHQQLFISERQIEIVVGARVKTFDTSLVRSSQTAYQQHRHIRGARVFLQTPAEFQAANMWHDDVADDDVRIERERDLDGLRAIGGRSDV